MLKAGIPGSMAGRLAGLVMKLRDRGEDGEEAEEHLIFVHPVLMQNLKVVGGVLKLRSDKYRWLRRNGWIKR
ncbi:MAG: hypothetical protein EHM36_00055 [Deltaproteobacteria bacterium]|nr:MAG: hypothetical protein EHM36_00055 [Deltaproteobacteria bacterium]